MKWITMTTVMFWTLLAVSGPATAESVTYQIAASVDDTWCTSSNSSYTNSTLYWPYLGAGRLGFLRWACDIPSGATITSAYVKLMAGATSTNTATGQMQLVDSDDCPAFSSNPWSSSMTGPTVNWIMPGQTGGAWYTSPDVSAIVQAFIDRPGYSPGNYLGLRNIYLSHTGDWVAKTFYTWDYSTHVYGAQLEINYTTTDPYSTLSYEYGATNTTYHCRPLNITATHDSNTVWTMSIWTPEAGYLHTAHSYYRAGEIASFKDVDYGGTPFEYSPEAGNLSSSGLVRMSGMQGDFLDGDGANDHSWQTEDSYTFTKTYTIETGVVGTLTVTIYPPLMFDDQWQTFIDGAYTIENNSGSPYSLWGTAYTAGTSSLALEDGGYVSWSIVNPATASAKPNSHVTDSTDGHQLYELYDWYGSTVASDLFGYYAKAAIKDNGYTSANNMRPGLNFALRADAMDFYYSDIADAMYGSTTVSTTKGVEMKVAQPGVFGSGATLPDGQSVTTTWQGVISTLPTYLPPIADAGDDQSVVDNDHSGAETVTLDGSGSIDYDGSIASYVWMEGSTPLATGETAQVALTWGTHTITLVATDDDGEVGLNTIQVKVREYPGTYYVDATYGSDGNAGTSGAPWATWSHAQGVLEAGDTLNCTGELGSVALGAHSPVGSEVSPITYARWPGQAAPHITTLTFDGTERDYHLVFDEFRFDPGYVTSAVMTVVLDGASYVTFDNCDFEGAKLSGASGDYAPYYPRSAVTPSVITAGNPGNASYITISDCHFALSANHVHMTEDVTFPEKQVRHWLVLNNEFDGASAFGMLVAAGGDHVVAGNYVHGMNTYHSAYHWTGAAAGTWPADLSFAPVTQDTTGASGIFYLMSPYQGSSRIYILPDDDDHPVVRNNTYVWRLDSDPTNVYFTPAYNGDSTHADCISLQGPVEDMLIEGNWFETQPCGDIQAMKIAPSTTPGQGYPTNITIQNNVFTSDGIAPTYLVLIAWGEDILFRHNLVYPGSNTYLGRSLRFVDVYGYGPWDDETLLFYNNILGGAYVDPGTTSTATFDYNCWMQAPYPGVTKGDNGFIVSGVSGVGFEDYLNMDFHLESDSDCVDAGDPDEAPGVSVQHTEGVDYDGRDRDSLPDVGPYEYVPYLQAAPGDANEDGRVDINDFILLKRSYGLASGAQWAQGDFDRDGDVDVEDFVILKKNYYSGK